MNNSNTQLASEISAAFGWETTLSIFETIVRVREAMVSVWASRSGVAVSEIPNLAPSPVQLIATGTDDVIVVGNASALVAVTDRLYAAWENEPEAVAEQLRRTFCFMFRVPMHAPWRIVARQYRNHRLLDQAGRG